MVGVRVEAGWSVVGLVMSQRGHARAGPEVVMSQHDHAQAGLEVQVDAGRMHALVSARRAVTLFWCCGVEACFSE